jgi:hypothetical protein
MDGFGRELRRMVDDQLREMYRHFVGQTLPPHIGELLEGAEPHASFASSRQKHCDTE